MISLKYGMSTCDRECPITTTRPTSRSESKNPRFLSMTSLHLLAVMPKYSSIPTSAISIALRLESHPHSPSLTGYSP